MKDSQIAQWDSFWSDVSSADPMWCIELVQALHNRLTGRNMHIKNDMCIELVYWIASEYLMSYK